MELSSFEKELIRSWQYSQSVKVDPAMQAIPLENIDFTTKKRLTSFLLYEWNQRKNFYRAKHQLLADHGAVIYYIDPHRCIYSHGGNLNLLAQLKTKGIKFGANLSDESIGTTGLTFTNHKEPSVYIIGQMHYSAIFEKYVTVALDFNFKNYSNMRQMIVYPIEKHSETMRNIVNATYYLEHYHTLSIDSKMNKLRNSALDASSEQAILLIDANGYIMDSNLSFINMFHTSYHAIIGQKLDTAIPNMSNAMTLLSTGQQAQFHIVVYNQPCLMKCMPVIENCTMLGMILQLSPSTEIVEDSKQEFSIKPKHTFESMIGNSSEFLKAKTKAILVAYSESNIMICGESGTGKELFAQAIHNASKRNNKPFIAINCAAIPRELIVSELFGHEEGAFTGARRSGNPGKFELANGGTLFLDEITEMPLDMQAVLLRTLENGEVNRLGGNKSVKIDVRIITATNRNIENFVREGHFRADLYYRLNVIKINLPPLRDRPEDIPPSASFYMNHFAQKMNIANISITHNAMSLICAYNWPGNMRQLRNAMEYAVTLAQKGEISEKELPEYITNMNPSGLSKTDPSPAAEKQPANAPNYSHTEKNSELNIRYNNENGEDSKKNNDNEKSIIIRIKQSMARNYGNKSKVAEELGISRSTLYRYLKEIQNEFNVIPDYSFTNTAPEATDFSNYPDYEQAMIHYLMIKYRGNKSKVADEMGISRNTLYRRLKSD